MKRFFLLLVVLILGVIAASPYAMGWLAQQRHLEFVELARDNDANLKVSSQYNLGFFDSYAETKFIVEPLSFGEGQQPKIPIKSFVLKHHISHDPRNIQRIDGKWVISQINTEFDIEVEDSAAQSQLAQAQAFMELLYPKQDPLQIKTFLFANGQGVTKIINPKFEFEMENKNNNSVTLYWGGFQGDIHHNAAFDKILGNWHMPSLRIVDDNGSEFNFGKLAGSSNIYRGLSGFWMGKGDVDLTNMFFVEQNQKLMELDGFKLQSVADESQATKNIRVDIITNFGRLNIPQGNFGPGQANLGISRLHGPSLQKLNKKAQAIQVGQINPQEMMEIFRTILQQKPMVYINNLNFQLPKGEIKLDLSAQIGDQQIKNPFDQQEVIKSVELDFHFYTPKYVVLEVFKNEALTKIKQEKKMYDLYHQGEQMPLPFEMTPEQQQKEAEKKAKEKIISLIEQRILIERPDHFEIHININDGNLDMNGQIEPLV